MAVVIHTIKNNQYAYNHHREGAKVVCDYLGKVGGSGEANKGTTIYKTESQPEVTQQQPITKVSFHQNIPMILADQVGKTTIWGSEQGGTEDTKSVSNTLKNQPEGLRPGVDEVEVLSKKEGYPFKVGDTEFRAGAHWSKPIEGNIERDKGRVRLFGDKGEEIIYHETGHALFDNLETVGDTELKNYDRNRAEQIRNQATAQKQEKLHNTDIKWNEILEKDRKEWDSIRERYYNGSAWVTKEEGKEIDRKANVVERRMKKHGKQRDSEVNDIINKYDPEIEVDKYHASISPTATKLNEFRQATWKEGGITPYSNAYVKANESAAITENFAEHATLYLTEHRSGSSNEALTVRVAKQYREERPESFKAFHALVLPHIEGWSVPIRTKQI